MICIGLFLSDIVIHSNAVMDFTIIKYKTFLGTYSNAADCLSLI